MGQLIDRPDAAPVSRPLEILPTLLPTTAILRTSLLIA